VVDFKEDRREEDFEPPAALLGSLFPKPLKKIDAGNLKNSDCTEKR
jgi:hypothetical protein